MLQYSPDGIAPAKGMLASRILNSETPAPDIDPDVHPHFSSIGYKGDVAEGRGVLLKPDGKVVDIDLKNAPPYAAGGHIHFPEVTLDSDYNRARYIFRAKQAAELFNDPEIEFFAYTMGKNKKVPSIQAAAAQSEKDTKTVRKDGSEGSEIASMIPAGIPIWHTDFHRRVAQMAADYQVDYNDALKYILHHERRHTAIGLADTFDFITGNEVRLENRLEKDLYSYFTWMAENTDGEQQQHYLNMAAIAKDRMSKSKELYSKRRREAQEHMDEDGLEDRLDAEETEKDQGTDPEAEDDAESGGESEA